MYENISTATITNGTTTIGNADTFTAVAPNMYDYKTDLVFGLDGTAYSHSGNWWNPDWTKVDMSDVLEKINGSWVNLTNMTKALSEELYKRGITANEAADAICIILKLFGGKDCDSGSLEPKPVSDERLNKLFGLEE